MVSKVSIFCHTQKSFANALFVRLGKGKSHAAKIYSEWFRKGAVSKEDPWVQKEALALVEELLSEIDFSLPEMAMKKEEGRTIKYLLRSQDGLESESVLIPMEAGNTLCLSSQIGCRQGCVFCETGRMGLMRNLSAKEIVAQVFYARFILGAPVRNLVFMGMGEPLDNFEEVMQAVKILTDPTGLAFGPSRVTISTSGHVDAIRRLSKEADPALNLAVSINAPNDAIRNRLMPVNRRWNMAQLKEAMLSYCSHPRRAIFAEYVLLRGINDSLECADDLALYLEGLKVKVNLIPYNSQSKDRYAPSALEDREAFLKRLREKGYQALLRHPKGQAIMAACGQLGNIQLRKAIMHKQSEKEISIPIAKFGDSD